MGNNEQYMSVRIWGDWAWQQVIFGTNKIKLLINLDIFQTRSWLNFALDSEWKLWKGIIHLLDKKKYQKRSITFCNHFCLLVIFQMVEWWNGSITLQRWMFAANQTPTRQVVYKFQPIQKKSQNITSTANIQPIQFSAAKSSWKSQTFPKIYLQLSPSWCCYCSWTGTFFLPKLCTLKFTIR